jgi:hypothetical protein
MGGQGGQPTMERRATYPGPGMMYGEPPQEMYAGMEMHPQQQRGMGHPMHHEMRGGHDMRGHDMREMRGGHDMREMRGEMRHGGQQAMVGAGAGGGLFGMML